MALTVTKLQLLLQNERNLVALLVKTQGNGILSFSLGTWHQSDLGEVSFSFLLSDTHLLQLHFPGQVF